MFKTRANASGNYKNMLFLQKIEFFSGKFLQNQTEFGDFRENGNSR
jgi:hypothetical protein